MKLAIALLIFLAPILAIADGPDDWRRCPDCRHDVPKKMETCVWCGKKLN